MDEDACYFLRTLTVALSLMVNIGYLSTIFAGGVLLTGILKTVVQRLGVWAVWSAPPRDSMRCWAWGRPSCDEVVVLGGWVDRKSVV